MKLPLPIQVVRLQRRDNANVPRLQQKGPSSRHALQARYSNGASVEAGNIAYPETGPA